MEYISDPFEIKNEQIELSGWIDNPKRGFISGMYFEDLNTGEIFNVYRDDGDTYSILFPRSMQGKTLFVKSKFDGYSFLPREVTLSDSSLSTKIDFTLTTQK
jgi:hypothetical protein